MTGRNSISDNGITSGFELINFVTSEESASICSINSSIDIEYLSEIDLNEQTPLSKNAPMFFSPLYKKFTNFIFVPSKILLFWLHSYAAIKSDCFSIEVRIFNYLHGQ